MTLPGLPATSRPRARRGPTERRPSSASVENRSTPKTANWDWARRRCGTTSITQASGADLLLLKLPGEKPTPGIWLQSSQFYTISARINTDVLFKRLTPEKAAEQWISESKAAIGK